MLLIRNGEIPAFIRYSTTKQRGVGRIEDGDVGIGYRLALLVYDSTRQMTVGFVGTLNEYLFSVLICTRGDTDGVEANHLLDGFGQTFVLDSSCDAEVLQFVVEEHDGVVGLLLCQLFESIRERHIIILA